MARISAILEFSKTKPFFGDGGLAVWGWLWFCFWLGGFGFSGSGGSAGSLEFAKFGHFLFAALCQGAFLQREIAEGFFEVLADVPFQSDGVAFGDESRVFVGEDFPAYDESGKFKAGDAAEAPADVHDGLQEFGFFRATGWNSSL